MTRATSLLAAAILALGGVALAGGPAAAEDPSPAPSVTSPAPEPTTTPPDPEPTTTSPAPEPSVTSTSPAPEPTTTSPAPEPSATTTSPAPEPSATTSSPAPVEVATVAPEIGEVTCDQVEILTPEIEGVIYTVGEVADDLSVVVTATAADGYVLTGDTTWTLTFEAPADCDVTPQPTLVPAGNSGELPTTGASLPVVVGSGLALLAAGAIVFVVARRRREPTFEA